MTIMRKLIPGIASVFLIVFACGYASLSQAAAGADTTAEYGTESIRSLETTSRLRELALLIDYYDEVLTQSARNYAFTQDKKWEIRYRESEPKLIATLEEALEKGDRIDKEFLERIDKANVKLVEMEYRSIELVNAGQTQQAADILESSQYWQQKKIYNQNLKAYVQRRGEAFSGALLSIRRNYPIVRLTDEEKKWLKAHPEIRLGFNPDMEPYVIVAEDGSLSGLLIEIYEKLQEILGIDVKIEIEYWPKMIEKARNGNVDGLLAAAAGPMALSLEMPQTKPIFHTFVTVFARQDNPLNVSKLEDLKGLTIAYLKGDRFTPKILEPIRENCAIIEADSALKSFTLVQSGKADVALGRNQDTYFLKKYVISNIKPIFSFLDRPVTVGATIRADWPELVEILNKGINALGEDRINNILAKWIELPASTKTFVLTEQEKTWLADHRDMRLGVDPTWPPFEFLDTTKIYSGIASDYVRRLNELMQINMAPVPELSWSLMMSKASKGEIDVLACEDNVVSIEAELPESLPGFDLADGLKRLQGNKTLYRKLLLNFGNRSQVQGSTFRVKDKEGIKDLKFSLKMLIFPNNCQFGCKFWIGHDEADAFS
jgi:ABC-type amino acid transport substrate-binding protein